MSFRKYDLITFDDDKKVMVLAVLLDQGNEYLFVNEVLPDESDFTEKCKVLRANYETGTLDKITDMTLLERLLPMFERKLAEE